MNIIGVCGVAIICAILSLVIKKHNGEIAFVLQICGCVIIVLFVLGEITQVTDRIREIADSFSINTDYIRIVLKALGICFIAEFAADCCKDSGCMALGNNILLCGKIMVLAAAMPMLNDLLTVALGLLSAG